MGGWGEDISVQTKCSSRILSAPPTTNSCSQGPYGSTGLNIAPHPLRSPLPIGSTHMRIGGRLGAHRVTLGQCFASLGSQLQNTKYYSALGTDLPNRHYWKGDHKGY